MVSDKENFKEISAMNLMKYRLIYFLISALVLIPGIYSLLTWGLKPAIDFTGGTLLELQITNDKLQIEITNSKLKEIAEEQGLEVSSVQSTGEGSYLLRMKPIDKNQNQSLQAALTEKFGSLEELRFETVGPTLGAELLRKTIIAVCFGAGFILFYVAFRFGELKYGLCAILAMFHDTLVLLGVFSLLGHFRQVEVDTLFVTAVLAALSFSVHDTVVIYDQIRSSLKRQKGGSFAAVANQAVASTLVRSLNNSLTIIFVLLALWLFGGETIKWFVLALLIGTASGTYSSTFIAVPLLVVWEKITLNKSKILQRSFRPGE